MFFGCLCFICLVIHFNNSVFDTLCIIKCTEGKSIFSSSGNIKKMCRRTCCQNKRIVRKRIRPSLTTFNRNCCLIKSNSGYYPLNDVSNSLLRKETQRHEDRIRTKESRCHLVEHWHEDK